MVVGFVMRQDVAQTDYVGLAPRETLERFGDKSRLLDFDFSGARTLLLSLEPVELVHPARLKVPQTPTPSWSRPQLFSFWKQLAAKLKAESEFEAFRQQKDAEYVSDFDRVLAETRKLGEPAPPAAAGKGKRGKKR